MNQTATRTRTYDWKAPITSWDNRRELDGKAYLQTILDGENVSSPMVQTMGIQLTELGDGYAVYTVDPAEYHYNPIGVVHGGLAATMFDTALASAIITKLPVGQVCATVDLHVHLLRALTVNTGKVRCEATAVHVGRMMGTAEGKIIGDDGKVYGHATASCVVMPAQSGNLKLPTTHDTRTFTWEDPMIPAAQAMQMSGVDFLRGIMKGEIPPPPIAKTLNMTGIEIVEEGTVRFGTHISPFQMNTAGTIHGGLTATLCDSALGCAVQTVVPEGMGYTTTELSVYFVRPVTPDIPKLYADATVIHGGNRIATAEAKVVDDNGKLYAHATTTCFVFPIRR